VPEVSKRAPWKDSAVLGSRRHANGAGELQTIPDAALSNECTFADLARTLADLGITYSDLGQPADALPVTEEALAIRRASGASGHWSSRLDGTSGRLLPAGWNIAPARRMVSRPVVTPPAGPGAPGGGQA
jgi:hypothetical protein